MRVFSDVQVCVCVCVSCAKPSMGIGEIINHRLHCVQFVASFIASFDRTLVAIQKDDERKRKKRFSFFNH